MLMYIPEKMQVNKFVDVAIPANKTYFSRLGEVAPSAEQFSGDEVVDMNQRKIDELDAYGRYAEEMAAKEMNKKDE